MINFRVESQDFENVFRMGTELQYFLFNNCRRYRTVGEDNYVGHGPDHRSIQIRSKDRHGYVQDVKIRDKDEEQIAHRLRDFYLAHGFSVIFFNKIRRYPFH